MNLTIADQLKLALNSAHEEFLKEDEVERKTDALRRMKGLIDEFLSFVPHECKFIFLETEEVLRKSSMNIGDFDPWEGSIAFEFLAKYAHNLLQQRWRQDFRSIKLSSGFFHHNIRSHLTDAEELLIKMGYELSEQDQLKLQDFNELRLKTASVDCIIAGQECLILSQIWQRVAGQEPDALLTIGDVFEYRTKTVGSAETVSENLIEDIRKRRLGHAGSTKKPTQISQGPIISNTTRLNEICSNEEDKEMLISPSSSTSTLPSFPHSGNDLSRSTSAGVWESEIIEESKMETDVPPVPADHLPLNSREVAPKEMSHAFQKCPKSSVIPSRHDVNLFSPSLASSVPKTTPFKGDSIFSGGKKRQSLHTNTSTTVDTGSVGYSNQLRNNSASSSGARGTSSNFNYPLIPKPVSKVSELGFQSRNPNLRHSIVGQSRPPPIQFSKVSPEEDEDYKRLYFKDASSTTPKVAPKLYSVAVSGGGDRKSPIRAPASATFSVSDDLSYGDFCREVSRSRPCPCCTLINRNDSSKCDACDYSFVYPN